MTALQRAAHATIKRLRALEDAERWQRDRWQAYAELNTTEGKSHREISLALATELTKAELTPAEIKKAGISHDNIAVGLARLRG